MLVQNFKRHTEQPLFFYKKFLTLFCHPKNEYMYSKLNEKTRAQPNQIGKQRNTIF